MTRFSLKAAYLSGAAFLAAAAGIATNLSAVVALGQTAWHWVSPDHAAAASAAVTSTNQSGGQTAQTIYTFAQPPAPEPPGTRTGIDVEDSPGVSVTKNQVFGATKCIVAKRDPNANVADNACH
jgi:hypothetical protein